MEWKKLKSTHYFEDPVPHIYSQTIFNAKEYDKLYETQNNLDHQTWQDFDFKYKLGFEFKDSFTKLDFNKEILCLWFFKERSDNTKSYVHLNNKQLEYFPNTFLITESKDIKLVQTKRKYIRHPFVQLDFSKKDYVQLVNKLKNQKIIQ